MPKSAIQRKSKSNQRQRAAEEVLNALERWSDRIGNHFTQKRGNPRKPYRDQITVYIPESRVTVGEEPDQLIIQPWARNISQAGMSFVFGDPIVQSHIVICLQPAGRKCIYLDAEIVRRRQVQNGFWEFGARFRGRANM